MTLTPTLEMDTSRYVSMCRDLMKISGKDFVPVLKVTTGQILAFCIKHTKAASRSKIVESVSKRRSKRFEFPDGEVISYSSRSGHEGDISFLDVSGKRHDGKVTVLKNGKAWHDMTRFHWSDERWAKFQAFLAQMKAAQGQYASKGNARTVKLQKGADLEAALGSRGLAKHSWYQIAEEIGIAAGIDCPEWVKTARAQTGETFQNGTAKMMLEGAAAFIEVFNDYPAAIRMDGQTLINYAIASRTLAFEREVEKGVFRDMKTRAERYPGLFVTN